MNTYDPTTRVTSSEFIDRELSVEEVVQAEAYEATISEAMAEVAMAGVIPKTSADTTAVEAGTEDITGAEAVPKLPIIPIIKRLVRGRYRSCRTYWELELRVDVDGYRPMQRVSGDFFYKTGDTVSYFGSFVVNSPTVTVTATHVIIRGLGTYTWSASAPNLQIIIARNTIFMPPSPAYVQFLTLDNKKGSSYTCLHESKYFRTVDLEQDSEEGVTTFASYDTGSLPSGGPARTLTTERAYAEAGVEMRTVGVPNIVDTAEAGEDVEWDNNELHAAMESHFSLWKDESQWKVWLFHANAHVYGPGLLGIMFDQKGPQRQGCAAFYQRIGGTTATNLRDQLYVCVHELGHCFNLFHSFHKKYMTPPMPNRYDSQSWMNYPRYYPGGESAYWNDFPFQFDDLEVVHLRHAFRSNIIMGGDPFGTGAAILRESGAFRDNVEDNSGLRLELEARKSFALGEPVVTEIKLYSTNPRGKSVHTELHPNFGAVQLAVQKPSGEVGVFEPPIQHCIEVQTTTLDAENPSIYESAYIGYDKERGHIFDQVGVYTLRGAYYALDGSVVLSNVMTLRVSSPLSTADEEVAELFLGEEQGMLLYLLGSDSEFLAKGNEAFDLVLDKYGQHPLAVYAQLVKGNNVAREFKTLTPDYRLAVREPQPEEAVKLLTDVIDASEKDKGVDNITLNMTMRRLANVQVAEDDKEGAKATMDRMVNFFNKKKLKPHVMSHIEEQAAAITGEL